MADAPLMREYAGDEVTLHWLSDSSTAPSDQNLIALTSIGELPSEFNVSNWHEYGDVDARARPTNRNARSIDIEAKYVPGNATLEAMRLAHDGRTKGFFALVIAAYGSTNSPGGQLTFEGFITKFSLTQPIDDTASAMMTISIDGSVTYTVNDDGV